MVAQSNLHHIMINDFPFHVLLILIRLYLNQLTSLLAEQGLELRVDKSTIETLASQGYEPEYGARPLRRVLRRQLENPLATQLLEEQFQYSLAFLLVLRNYTMLRTRSQISFLILSYQETSSLS